MYDDVHIQLLQIIQSNTLYPYVSTFTNSACSRSRFPDILVTYSSPALVARTAFLETPHS